MKITMKTNKKNKRENGTSEEKREDIKMRRKTEEK